MYQNKPKIVIIVGPTASGKSDMAVLIAKKFNGQIISADSRQVYKGLNIGSGKITKKEMQGIPHYMLDVVNPKKRFNVVDYKKQTKKHIENILQKNKLPIIIGGTGFYIQSIVDGIVLPEVPVDKVLQSKLEKLSLVKLQKKLQKMDTDRYNNIDIQNPRRLIRAIEIASKLGKVPKTKKQISYNSIQIGIQTDTEILNKRIHDRLLSRMKSGMLAEVKNLHQKGLTWKRLEELGLEYRYLARYLRKHISKKEMLEQIETETRRYAKRQKTWFKKDKRIHWFKLSDKQKIFLATSRFL